MLDPGRPPNKKVSFVAQSNDLHISLLKNTQKILQILIILSNKKEIAESRTKIYIVHAQIYKISFMNEFSRTLLYIISVRGN